MILGLVKLKININYHTWVLPSKVSCFFLRASTAMQGLTHASLCPQLLPCDCGTLHELYPHHPGQGHAPGGGGQSRDLYRCSSVPLGGDQRYSSWVGGGCQGGWVESPSEYQGSRASRELESRLCCVTWEKSLSFSVLWFIHG